LFLSYFSDTPKKTPKNPPNFGQKKKNSHQKIHQNLTDMQKMAKKNRQNLAGI
jgi:hypothetical protein